MVITIQTDGATNFDRPVPIAFPNLPDPDTGEKLPPGAKSALWSFNNDLGDWEVVGPMTVTEDGNFVKTDAGVGVSQPGWHGQRPGTEVTGPDEPEQVCPEPPDIGYFFALDVAATAADCAKEFVKVGPAVKAGMKALSAIKSTKSILVKIAEDLKNGQLDCVSMRLVLLRMKKSLKEVQDMIFEGIDAINPLTKLVAAVKCVV